MSSNDSETYIKSPAFQEAMDHFRVGRWDAGFLKLIEVEKNYPMEANLRALHQEMEVRSRVTLYEIEENKKQHLQHNTKMIEKIYSLEIKNIFSTVQISLVLGGEKR